ncbi:right-handed parallel beta-helix repeat-containing protein [Modestobacter marinus]|uniref:right-handed parallel beta-helix repeat-containing protein n=1 Tax=Modestobacter marinus TaxID=477641 RepID=UPI001C980D4A|nr:right-handed parallel beta-helix repeat-containing protein [Modestobacter marinus]
MRGLPRRLVTRRRLAAAVVLTAGLLAAGGLPGTPGDEGGTSDRAAPPAPREAALAGSTTVQGERQSAVLAADDRRLLELVGSISAGAGTYVQAVGGVDTQVLTRRERAWTLEDLIALGAAQVQPDDAVLVTRHVLVAPGARLTIEAPGRAVRLRSQPSGFASLVAWKAELTLSGAAGRPLRLSSWDPGRGTADVTPVDGRSYVREVGGAMWLRDVDATHLGFWAGRTSGVAWTGSATAPATGGAVGSSFRSNHYGAFSSEGADLVFTGSVFAGNTVDGLALHRRTVRTTVQDSTARDNGRHGFSADRGSQSVTYRGVTAVRNSGSGVWFSGSPLSTNLSAGGAPLRAYGQLRVAGGRFAENGRAGIRVVDGHQVVISGAEVVGNRDGVVLDGTTSPTRVDDTVVTGQHRFGIAVSGGTATVADNRVTGSTTGIRVQDADVAVTGNAVTEATAHGISVIGRAEGTALADNTVAGRGPSALDAYRLAAGLSVVQSGNDVTGWARDRDNSDYWASFVPNHPMLVLWVVVLGVPLALRLRARRHRGSPGRAPYQDDLLRERSGLLRVDAAR